MAGDPTTTGSHDGGMRAEGAYPFKIGDLDVIALHDGVLMRDRPDGFVRNASSAEVGEAFAAIGLPRDKLTLTFNALAIRNGSGVVLIDTGFGEGGPAGTGQIVQNLAAAGIAPGDVSTVLISHFHGDHISGLRGQDGALVFPNAEVCVPTPEWDFWMDDGNLSSAPEALKGHFNLARKTFQANDMEVRQFGWGDEVLSGITALQASGHTPGMTAFEIVSGDEATMFVADITNNPLIFARHPEWQAMFDINPDEAVATRKRFLDRAAAEQMRLSFFHAPFPSTGYILKSGAGYEFAPAMWTTR
ncbi:MBL fold metallo-hydrolase [Acuticoccus kandeliae]|uniref:MBL fold metallo-hydrolase n=1 Tax=Acuticoccus kandeliae TaxID=2073160 RepID=UPI000D3EB8C3|nr:MBL fold metallo-hydrolase [Acuticoccus kandeliae]